MQHTRPSVNVSTVLCPVTLPIEDILCGAEKQQVSTGRGCRGGLAGSCNHKDNLTGVGRRSLSALKASLFFQLTRAMWWGPQYCLL
jgi:hypothetical protein